jgi:hypothetical protein
MMMTTMMMMMTTMMINLAAVKLTIDLQLKHTSDRHDLAEGLYAVHKEIFSVAF